MEMKLIELVVLIGALGRVVEAQQAATALTTTVNRTGCGSTKLCVSNELNCDPAGNSSCFFSSFQVTNQAVQVELSGPTSGYVALELNLLNQTGSNSVGFVCLKSPFDNTSVLFQAVYGSTTNINTATVATVSNIQGAVRNQNIIQCTFTLTGNITITTSTNQTVTANLIVKNSTIVGIYNGTVTGTTPGFPNKIYDSQAALSLNDPLSNSAPSKAPLNITRTGCGITKLCVSNELNCDPAGNSSCFFSSFQVTNQAVQVELSGPTSGYVALGLTGINQTGNDSIVFVCLKNPADNTSVLFQTVYGNTTSINIVTVATVSNIQGAVRNQNIIQCTFTLTGNITITTSTNQTVTVNLNMKNSTVVGIYNGTVTGTTPGLPNKIYDSQAALSLNDPLSNSPSKAPLNITRTGCGSTKLCVSSKYKCVPGTSGCFFTSIQRNNQTNQTLFFELSGTASGYVAVGLKNQNTTVVFVCGNNKTGSSSSFFFQTSTKNGSSLTPANVSTVYSIQGEVTQNQSLDVVQCVFNTSSAFSVTTKADSPPNFSISIANGTISGTQLGDPTTLVETKELNLGVPDEFSSAPTTIISVWTHVFAVLFSAVTLHVL